MLKCDQNLNYLDKKALSYQNLSHFLLLLHTTHVIFANFEWPLNVNRLELGDG